MKFDLDPKFERAWQYANTFMYKAVKNEAHLTVFLKDPEMRKTWSAEELAFLRDAWFVITTGACDPKNKDVTVSVTEETVGEPVQEEEVTVEETTVSETPKKTYKKKNNQ